MGAGGYKMFLKKGNEGARRYTFYKHETIEYFIQNLYPSNVYATFIKTDCIAEY